MLVVKLVEKMSRPVPTLTPQPTVSQDIPYLKKFVSNAQTELILVPSQSQLDVNKDTTYTLENARLVIQIL